MIECALLLSANRVMKLNQFRYKFFGAQGPKGFAARVSRLSDEAECDHFRGSAG